MIISQLFPIAQFLIKELAGHTTLRPPSFQLT